jgi:predicted MFS family arabinose efflux permease
VTRPRVVLIWVVTLALIVAAMVGAAYITPLLASVAHGS